MNQPARAQRFSELLMNEHRLSQENQDRLLKMVAEFSDH